MEDTAANKPNLKILSEKNTFISIYFFFSEESLKFRVDMLFGVLFCLLDFLVCFVFGFSWKPRDG